MVKVRLGILACWGGCTRFSRRLASPRRPPSRPPQSTRFRANARNTSPAEQHYILPFLLYIAPRQHARCHCGECLYLIHGDTQTTCVITIRLHLGSKRVRDNMLQCVFGRAMREEQVTRSQQELCVVPDVIASGGTKVLISSCGACSALTLQREEDGEAPAVDSGHAV